VPGGHHHPFRQDAVGEDQARPVHVGEKRLERQHPLAHPERDVVPFDRVDDPGDQVQRERPLLARVVEGDAPVGERPRHLIRPVAQIARIQRLQRGEQRLVGMPRHPGPLEHLVPCGGKLITVENVRHSESVDAACCVLVTEYGPVPEPDQPEAARMPTRRPAVRRPRAVPTYEPDVGATSA